MLGAEFEKMGVLPMVADSDKADEPRSFTITVRLDRGVYIALDEYVDRFKRMKMSKNQAVNQLLAAALEAEGLTVEEPPEDGRKKRWQREDDEG